MRSLSFTIVCLILVATTTVTVIDSRPVRAQSTDKVIILGFDGADPDLVQTFMDQGRLPNLKRLAEQGTFSPLATTNPAESPVSWASFTTGQGPGHHGIFDFLRRVPGTYLPEIALAKATTQPIMPSRAMRGAIAAGLGLAAFLLGFLALKLFKVGARGALAAGVLLALPVAAVGSLAAFRWIPYEMPKAESTRKGVPFWDEVAAAGKRVTAIDIPVTFPATANPGVQLTTGLGTPDVRQTWGNWSVYSSASFDSETSETAGNLKHVVMNGDRGQTEIRGPVNFIAPRNEGGSRPEIPIPMVIERIGPKSMRLKFQGNVLELDEGEWSDWATVTFKMNPLVKLVAMTRFKLLTTEPDFKIYQEPLNFHPHHLPKPPGQEPTVRISYPTDYASKLAHEYGLRETVGWSIATNPLKDDEIDIDTFLEDLRYTLERREKVIKGELNKDDWDLFIGVFLSSDRMQHMMYRFYDESHPFYDAELAARYGDQIGWVYEQMDRIVGDVMRDHVDDGTHLMIVSDHGFHSFRRGVNINTWLVKNGFMALKGHDPSKNYQKLEDFFDPEGRFFQNVDWSRTKAYCLGLGSIYMNLRGREPQGAVRTSEYRDAVDELIAALKEMRDPEDPERPVVLDVFRREEIFKGPELPNAPDLFVGFNEGYRVSWQTAAGGIPPDVFEDNMNNWSGDHCSVSPDISAGIFFSNRSLGEADRSILDIAPTVLTEFGVPVGAELEGSSLVR